MNATIGPLEYRHRMTPTTMDAPRHVEYMKGFNDALRLADATIEDTNKQIYEALVDLLKFAEIWQGSSVEILKARAVLNKKDAP